MNGLYLVGTPIGNLSDMSPRAIETLKAVDFIAAEDTRVTIKLLNYYDIKKPMVSCHEHNIREKGESLATRMLAGESCAIVTDAGMPCISDPGEELVAICHRFGVPVTVVPGPTAMASAVALSGLSTGRFTFEGFLSVNKPSRLAHLSSLKSEERTMVFYEAPHKLLRTLTDMLTAFGDRDITICRELTKMYEETIRTTLSQAVQLYTDKTPKGEFVLVISGAPPKTEAPMTFEEAVALTKAMIADGEAPTMAAKSVAKDSPFKKADLYKAIL